MKPEIPKTFVVSAEYRTSTHGSRKEYYASFGTTPEFASIWGAKVENIRTVILEVIEGMTSMSEKDDNSDTYWGFYNFETKRLSMIYPSWIQLYVCFPCGPVVAEERGHGICLNLKIIKVDAYHKES